MKRFSQTWGWYLVFGVALAPVVIWITTVPLQYRFDNVATTLLNLGRLSSLVGICFFAMNFVLAARPKWLEGSFGGLNKVFRAHHTFGGLAFTLLLLHPIFLTAQYLPISFQAASQFTLSFYDWPRNFGRLGLLTLMGVLIITYYIPLKYQIWKFSHQVIGLALFLGGLHVFLIPSDVSRYPVLRYYILTVVVIGLAAYFYRVIFGKYLVSRFKYTVKSIRKFPGGILEIIMEPVSHIMHYHAGQFLFISLQQPGIPAEFHPFSITSAADSNLLSIGVKSLGDYTNTLSQLKNGTLAKIEGPFGQFSPKKNVLPEQIWIAGGIGITPFLSMARTPFEPNKKATLYYSVNKIDEAVFLPEFIELAKKNAGLKVVLHETSIRGYISADSIKSEQGIVNKEIFICGPKPMMKSLREQFVSNGVEDDFIHTEEFDL